MKMWQKMRSEGEGRSEESCTSRGQERVTAARKRGDEGDPSGSRPISLDARKAVFCRTKQKARISLPAIRSDIIQGLLWRWTHLASSPFHGNAPLLFAATKPFLRSLLFFSILHPVLFFFFSEAKPWR